MPPIQSDVTRVLMELHKRQVAYDALYATLPVKLTRQEANTLNTFKEALSPAQFANWVAENNKTAPASTETDSCKRMKKRVVTKEGGTKASEKKRKKKDEKEQVRTDN